MNHNLCTLHQKKVTQIQIKTMNHHYMMACLSCPFSLNTLFHCTEQNNSNIKTFHQTIILYHLSLQQSPQLHQRPTIIQWHCLTISLESPSYINQQHHQPQPRHISMMHQSRKLVTCPMTEVAISTDHTPIIQMSIIRTVHRYMNGIFEAQRRLPALYQYLTSQSQENDWNDGLNQNIDWSLTSSRQITNQHPNEHNRPNWNVKNHHISFSSVKNVRRITSA